ncbi:MAG: hypothetical protein JWM44_2886 [Bacilli bacterium]|nr:hypothetical protein [Bacilli bacterium]
MRQSTKEKIVLQAEKNLLQNDFSESIGSAFLLAEDEIQPLTGIIHDQMKYNPRKTLR